MVSIEFLPLPAPCFVLIPNAAVGGMGETVYIDGHS